MTELRWIWIDGPPLLRDDDLSKPRGVPLWSLQVGASYFDRDNAADYAHPLRTLMIDARETAVSVEGTKPFFQTGKLQHALRAPRLFDVHLIAGAGKAPYRPNANSETLQLNGYPGGTKIGGELVNKDPSKPNFSTVGGRHDDGGTDAQEGFVHIVAEPQLVADTQKGDFIDQAGHTGKDDEKGIRVPRLRLLHGAIRLKVTGPLPWLGNIDPGKALPGAPKSFELILTPSGIEIVTAVEFPGTTGKLRGVFLIAPRGQREMQRDRMTGDDATSKFKPSALTLTLLPDETAQLPADGGTTPISHWMDVWRNAAAPQLPHDDQLRCGIDIRALPSGLPPRFCWPLYLKKDGTAALVAATVAAADPPLAVDAPTDRLRIELRGSKGPDGTHEGAAVLMTSRLRIATPKAADAVARELHRQKYLHEPKFPQAAGGTVVFAEARPDQDGAQLKPPRYWTVSDIKATDKVDMSLLIGSGTNSALPLAHDEHLLAARLRAAAGWEEPQPQQLVGGNRTPFTQANRPVVSGFVPLDRGWLQLPFPNLPPPDIQKDSSLLGAIDPTPTSVLDGFIRIAQRPVIPFQSGYQSAAGGPVGKTAPWSVTVEGAGVAVVMCAVEAGLLKQSRVVLREPDLAARGLLWLSADRPDALEALPRLGAGPGSFFDLDLTTTPAPDPSVRVVTAALGVLTLTYKSDGTVTRNDLDISVAFNPAAADWDKGLAATDDGRKALAQAREVLLGRAVVQSGSAGLADLRKAQTKAEGDLAVVEANFARAEQRRVTLASQIAGASGRQAGLEAHRAALVARQVKARAEADAAKAAGDSSRILEANAVLSAIERGLAEVAADATDTANGLAALKAEKARLDGDANVRSEIVRVARSKAEAASVAYAKAEGATTFFKSPLPWPAVAWLRHPRLPLAAGMPMTRAAASAVPPLESREFAPFVATTAVTGSAIQLAALTWKGKEAFPDLGASPVFEHLAEGWPRPDVPANDGQVLGPSQGVPFAAFGVPGTEVMPRTDQQKQWVNLEFAVRYDLPSLDEAFATAGLPPVAEPLPQEDEREKAPDKPAATALDWPLLQGFWEDQQRRRNLSLVIDSYLDNFQSTAATDALKVRTLIRGATWSIKAKFDVKNPANDFPYGAVTFGEGANAKVLSANVALQGLFGKLSFKSAKVIELDASAPGTPAFDMLGWSPSSFDSGDFRIDNQGFGIANPQRSSGVITRRYRSELGASDKVFASAENEIVIAGPVPFGFWFKDLPLDSGGVFDGRVDDTQTGVPETAVDFAAWLSPEEGYEWRLYRQDSSAAFEGGRDRFPFFGVEIEPLRLLKLELPASQGLPTSRVPRKIEILARMFFADNPDQPITGGNLVIMSFVSGTGDLHLESITGLGKKPMPMKFAFEATAADRRRQILLRATPSWQNNQLVLGDAALSLALHGRNILLDKASVTCDEANGGSVTIKWRPGTADPPIEPGQGRLRVTQLLITRASVTDQQKVALCLDRAVEICSTRGRKGDPEVVARFDECALSSSLSLLNSKFDKVPNLREDDQALVFTFDKPDVTGLEGLLPGLTTGPAAVGASIMLAATVDPPSSKQPWILPLGCGRCEGEIRAGDGAVSSTLHTQRIRWEIDGRLPDEKKPKLVWDGFVAISGALEQTSAIIWPRLATGKGGTDGRRRITPVDGGKPLVDHARYIFDDHHLPLEVCRSTGGNWTFDQPWTAFAAANHKLFELSDDGQTQAAPLLEWSGLESIAIGHVDDLIPALPGGNTIEPVTFAPRYRHAFSNASADTAKMMIQPGLGAIQTVLEGMSGRAFREGFKNASGEKKIVAAAGFLGLQMSDRADRDAEEPLLRLPFLAGLGTDPLLKPGALKQSDFPAGGIELAWVDSAAARSLLVRDGHAVAPASAIEADLIAAVRVGALIDEDGQPPKGEIVAAMAAEQSFRANPPAESAATWPNAPYWIGSAVTVSRAVERYTREGARPFRPLSLVAGSILREKRTRGTAALLQGLPAKLLKQPPPAATPALISGGTILAVENWPGLDPAKAEGSSVNGYAAGLAAARHARPLFAVVRFVDDHHAAHYTAMTLPRAVRADLPTVRRGSREQTRFAEGARGYAIDPGTAAAHWLYPVVEGQVAAVRDDKSSGLAGLGRRLDLPAQAGVKAVDLDKEENQTKLAQSLIWFTEKRNPVYLPLGINDMESPPIPWLQAAPPRVRLPADADVAMVLFNSGLGDGTRVPKRMAAQSFLPDTMDALAVSERAGIVTARRAFLMGATLGDHVFDAEQSRFGRAGQAGSSTRRWMRTPRPSQLPVNTGDPDRDRRPEASPLLPLAPLRFLVGPADTVRGSTDRVSTLGNSVPWSATIVAAPLSDGVLSNRWDGSLRLTVELDLATDPKKPADPNAPPSNDAAELLTQLLFPADASQNAIAYGSLKASDQLFRLRWITVQKSSDKWAAFSLAGREWKTGDGPIVWRTRIDLVVDPREQQPVIGAGPGGVHAGLAAALSAGAFAIELRLTVHPTETKTNAPSPIAVGQPVKLKEADQDALAVGKDRPPLTLRWTLPAVTAIRGGMPLLPSTLLFVDPAYEAGLANPPHEKSVLVDTQGVKDLPANRGAVRAFFSADRGRVNRRGSVAFMADVRFERLPEALAPFTENDFANQPAPLVLLFKLIPRSPSDPIRFLTIDGKAEPPVALASVYELSLAALTETDGSPARMQAGDVLELTISERQPEQVVLKMHNTELGPTGVSGDVKLSKPLASGVKPTGDQSSRGFGLSLALTLTDEPVVEPPTALYAALTHATRDNQPALSLPLYAQSPLPWRVDFRNLKRDFRIGLVHRSASFVWGLSRSLADMDAMATPVRTHIVKIDRNGQSHLPEEMQEFLIPDRVGTVK
jgi:hypothetical protein